MSDARQPGDAPARGRRKVRVEQGGPCEDCGTPLERVLDAYTNEPKGWRCPKVFYDGYAGAWEHA